MDKLERYRQFKGRAQVVIGVSVVGILATLWTSQYRPEWISDRMFGWLLILFLALILLSGIATVLISLREKSLS